MLNRLNIVFPVLEATFRKRNKIRVNCLKILLWIEFYFKFKIMKIVKISDKLKIFVAFKCNCTTANILLKCQAIVDLIILGKLKY